jgi:hypothetical protein
MNIIIIITPFHIQQFNYIKENNVDVKKSEDIIFYSEYINLKDLKSQYSKAIYYKIPFGHLKLDEILNFDVFNVVKKLKNKNRKVDGIQKKINFKKVKHLIFFTDKEYFTQYFLSKAKKLNSSINVIFADEGVGNYIKSSSLDRLKNIIYNIFGYLLLGFKLRFVRTLGTNPFINIYYSRLPEFIPYKYKKVQYLKIKNKVNVDYQNLNNQSKAILITAPIKNKIQFFKEIEKTLNNYDIKLIIKPHPREPLSDYESFSNVIENSISFELLNYQDYKYIINFNSSALIDVINKGYPLKNIITFNIRKFSTSIPFFNKTIKINNIEELKTLLNENPL